jgi:hypothetical protein
MVNVGEGTATDRCDRERRERLASPIYHYSTVSQNVQIKGKRGLRRRWSERNGCPRVLGRSISVGVRQRRKRATKIK